MPSRCSSFRDGFILVQKQEMTAPACKQLPRVARTNWCRRAVRIKHSGAWSKSHAFRNLAFDQRAAHLDGRIRPGDGDGTVRSTLVLRNVNVRPRLLLDLLDRCAAATDDAPNKSVRNLHHTGRLPRGHAIWSVRLRRIGWRSHLGTTSTSIGSLLLLSILLSVLLHLLLLVVVLLLLAVLLLAIALLSPVRLLPVHLLLLLRLLGGLVARVYLAVVVVRSLVAGGRDLALSDLALEEQIAVRDLCLSARDDNLPHHRAWSTLLCNVHVGSGCVLKFADAHATLADNLANKFVWNIRFDAIVDHGDHSRRTHCRSCSARHPAHAAHAAHGSHGSHLLWVHADGQIAPANFDLDQVLHVFHLFNLPGQRDGSHVRAWWCLLGNVNVGPGHILQLTDRCTLLSNELAHNVIRYLNHFGDGGPVRRQNHWRIFLGWIALLLHQLPGILELLRCSRDLSLADLGARHAFLRDLDVCARQALHHANGRTVLADATTDEIVRNVNRLTRDPSAQRRGGCGGVGGGCRCLCGRRGRCCCLGCRASAVHRCTFLCVITLICVVSVTLDTLLFLAFILRCSCSLCWCCFLGSSGSLGSRCHCSF
eukprot:m.9726 g.9726  ORF g.9726 m.9726 type:complete len:595 (+) comp6988_c0_seq1:1271-3055(+)